MKATTKISSTIILVGLIALLTPILNVSAAKPSVPPFLEGDPLNLLGMWIQGIDEVDVPVDEPFYEYGAIGHGWISLTPEERGMFLDDSLTRFELDIDGVPQTLRKWMFTVKFDGFTWLFKVFCIQFEPYEFDVGSYEFEGRQYYLADPQPFWSHTVTVNFVAGS